jgi:2'-hydroxyisoflavone reductase
MDILFLGGKSFVGRHMLEAALGRGHRVSIFSRGKTNNDLFPEATHLIGDRDGELGALHGKTWDAVVDTCGYFPRQVKDSASLLRDQVGQYVFISTMSVYDYMQNNPIVDESAPLIVLDDPTTETLDSQWAYGGLKVLCEKAINDIFSGDVLHLRPTFVAGPYDPTDRFTYWLRRIAQGGDVAVPAYPDQLIQWIDARDLADFIINSIEQRVNGVFNVAAPSCTWEAWLKSCRDILGSQANFVWFNDESFLREFVGLKGIASDMFPFCMDKKYATARCNLTAEKARKVFFKPRDLSETVGDTIRWDKNQTARERITSITPEQEIELLEQWKGWSHQ